jgi:hypothetical protein
MFSGLSRGFQGGATALNPYSNRLLGFSAGMLGGGPSDAMKGMIAGSALDRESADRRKLNEAIAGLKGQSGVLSGLNEADWSYLSAAGPEAIGDAFAARLKGPDPTKYGFQSMGGKMFRTNPDTGQLEEVYSDESYNQPKPMDIFQAEQGMRKEVHADADFQRFQKAAPVYQSMVASGSQNDQFGDINLVYGLATIMDPGSVVREGEQLIVRSAAGLTPEVLGYINSLNGGAKLIPATRQKLLREAKGRMDEYKRAAEQQLKFYENAAAESGLDPGRIVPDLQGLGEFVAAGGTVNPDGSYTDPDGFTASPE